MNADGTRLFISKIMFAAGLDLPSSAETWLPSIATRVSSLLTPYCFYYEKYRRSSAFIGGKHAIFKFKYLRVSAFICG